MKIPYHLPMGRRVAAVRRHLRLTQRQLAVRMHHSQSWVAAVERNIIRCDHPDTVAQLAAALRVPVLVLDPSASPAHQRVAIKITR
jgi:transcriptional regulator with XRE-family HTH domain